VAADNSGQNVTAVSSRNIPLEYRAYYSVIFSVAVNGKQVLEPREIKLTNRYEYNATEVLGKAEEYDVLSASQANDIARQILIQISTL
jgi:outer membrane lipopolysaccharide assembly protein LptE/RlpB